jgi:hypothetical protein
VSPGQSENESSIHEGSNSKEMLTSEHPSAGGYSYCHNDYIFESFARIPNFCRTLYKKWKTIEPLDFCLKCVIILESIIEFQYKGKHYELEPGTVAATEREQFGSGMV